MVSCNDKTKFGSCNRQNRGRAINETDDIESLFQTNMLVEIVQVNNAERLVLFVSKQ